MCVPKIINTPPRWRQVHTINDLFDVDADQQMRECAIRKMKGSRSTCAYHKVRALVRNLKLETNRRQCGFTTTRTHLKTQGDSSTLHFISIFYFHDIFLSVSFCECLSIYRLFFIAYFDFLMTSSPIPNLFRVVCRQ